MGNVCPHIWVIIVPIFGLNWVIIVPIFDLNLVIIVPIFGLNLVIIVPIFGLNLIVIPGKWGQKFPGNGDNNSVPMGKMFSRELLSLFPGNYCPHLPGG